MENSIQIQGIRNMLSHSGCPEDLLESYLQFLQTEGQQVQIVRGEVFVMLYFGQKTDWSKNNSFKLQLCNELISLAQEYYGEAQKRRIFQIGICS